jgi:hypothetical protein
MQAALVLNLAASEIAFQVKPPDLHVPEHVKKGGRVIRVKARR